MKKILLLILALIAITPGWGQYPFDRFKRPGFKSYNNWKLIEKENEKKIHQTVTIPKFFADSVALTIQFTIDNSDKVRKNIIRIYKGKKTIQSFRIDRVDYMPPYISAHPVKVADLNGDSLLDIKITYDYYSNGLSLSYRPIYLIQNDQGSFTKYSFDNMYEDRLDFERDFDNDGAFEIQSVQLFQENNHSYWRFNVFKITDAGLVDISDKVGYPIFIQFLKKRNHKQADIKLSRPDDWSQELEIVTDKGVVIK
jgi:hypothetical protein